MRFNQYLHRPYSILDVEIDQMGVFTTFFTFALLFGGFSGWSLLWWPATAAAVYFYTKAKRRYPRGFFKHFLYFLGFMELKGYPEFFEDRFLE